MNGVEGVASLNRKWFTVNASKTSGSPLTLVSGLEFCICSTGHMVVDSTSSVSVLFPTFAHKVFLQLITSRSHTLPKCGAPGGLNFHFICFWAKDWSMSDWFQAAIHSRVSLAVPTKFFPLSVTMILGFPLRTMNLVLATRHASDSKPGTLLTCTALVIKHVNRQHDHFISFFKINTANGPN